jgi:hypothetical protein
VRIGGSRALGLLVLPGVVLAATACTGENPRARAQPAGAAVQSYAAPSGAPGYCESLATTTHLTEVPVALGTLTARPGDVEAKLALRAAVDELQAVGEQVSQNARTAELGTALDDLVAALDRAEGGPITDSVRSAVSTGLDEVGRLVQPVCDFPA